MIPWDICCICNRRDNIDLLYCYGRHCTVIVHEECYGVVNNADGWWLCDKCMSLDKDNCVICVFCPSRDGAFKRTNGTGWAHALCATYITSSKPVDTINLLDIPCDRFSLQCYICIEEGRDECAECGISLNCATEGCEKNFHVTCGQKRSLLWQRPNESRNAIEYGGYCIDHKPT